MQLGERQVVQYHIIKNKSFFFRNCCRSPYQYQYQYQYTATAGYFHQVRHSNEEQNPRNPAAYKRVIDA
jgi:hypothetical protein